MGWMDSPQCFCAFSETLKYLKKNLMDTDHLVPSYDTISKIPATGWGLPHTPESLTHNYFYANDAISAVQGDTDLQH